MGQKVRRKNWRKFLEIVKRWKLMLGTGFLGVLRNKESKSSYKLKYDKLLDVLNFCIKIKKQQTLFIYLIIIQYLSHFVNYFYFTIFIL